MAMNFQTNLTSTGNFLFSNTNTTQANQPQITWKTINSNTPFIGFATDQTDGTFLFGSIEGTTYAKGLAIGGGSKNLLWKGKRVLTVDDIVTLSGLGGVSTVTASGTAPLTLSATKSDTTVTITGSIAAATTSAAGSMSANDKSKLDNTNIAYGTCSTAAATAAKVVTVSGNTKWALKAGALVSVLFTYTNTASNPTLNVNGTGAKNIYYNTTQITTGSLSYAGYANRVATYMYDGTQYRFISWAYDANTNTQIRVYRQTSGYNSDYPILVSRTATSAIATVGTNDSYEGVYAVIGQDGAYTPTINPHTGKLTASAVYGAVWNDYAEFRNQTEVIEPGYCVISSSNGKVSKTTSRCCPCDGIVSDTYGFAIGETDDCKTPLATSGRVLAYYSGDIADYTIGDAVCAGADGKVSKMTRAEIREWPDRIIGTVSEFPEYETWGTGNVKVNGRIWIKVR